MCVGAGDTPRFGHKQNQIDIVDRTRHSFIERFIECIAVAGLKARRIDKHILGLFNRADARDAMPCGLCFARGNADLLSDQSVEQRGLADIGLANDSNQPAALTG